jgi:hypothetical protein
MEEKERERREKLRSRKLSGENNSYRTWRGRGFGDALGRPVFSPGLFFSAFSKSLLLCSSVLDRVPALP